MSANRTTPVFLTIVCAQFCGTSLWFAGNAALPILQLQFGWPDTSLGLLTAAVQLGFIAGTLLFSLLSIADRFSPSRVFFISCLAGGFFNVLLLIQPSSLALAIVSRSLTGLALAGIYPVGMKIAADWQERGLGLWLGALVGALVLGTAFPHGMKLMPAFVDVTALLVGITSLAATGGVLILLIVPDGPFRKRGSSISFLALREIFRFRSFRAPAFGYFGHMWELYAFWAFVPWAVQHYSDQQSSHDLSLPWFSFIIIASGSIGCLVGGFASSRYGGERVAFCTLLCSGICCLLSPFMWSASTLVFTVFMLIWGITVVADSPQFSTLVARSAPEHVRGSAITLVICIGFGITIFSIQLLNYFQHLLEDYLFLFLVPGPLLGLYAMRKSI